MGAAVNPPSDRYRVPSLVQLRAMSDDELRDCQLEIESALDRIQRDLDSPRSAEHARRVQSAVNVYVSGRLQVRTVRELRKQDQRMFVKPPAVVDVQTADRSLRAISRLIGLLHAEHKAAKAYRSLDPDTADGETWERIEAAWDHAHDTVESALGSPLADQGAES
jgi:uncharacterized protein YjiS (DUF1127 family)